MRVIIFLAIISLSGCAGGSLDRSYSYSSLTDSELLLKILSGLVVPTSYHVYADDHRIENIEDVELEDVVEYNSSCIMSELDDNATRLDLEVINYLWVESNGSAKYAIINSLGRQAYLSGVEAYSNATFDCGLVVSRWLNEKNN